MGKQASVAQLGPRDQTCDLLDSRRRTVAVPDQTTGTNHDPFASRWVVRRLVLVCRECRVRAERQIEHHKAENQQSPRQMLYRTVLRKLSNPLRKRPTAKRRSRSQKLRNLILEYIGRICKLGPASGPVGRFNPEDFKLPIAVFKHRLEQH